MPLSIFPTLPKYCLAMIATVAEPIIAAYVRLRVKIEKVI